MKDEGNGSRRFDPEDYVDSSRYPDIAARMRRRAAKVEEATSEHMSWLEESGELRHLHGKPLDLSDDPNWLVTKVLKQAGFSHPLLEQRKELYAPLAPVEGQLDALARRREWLLRPESRSQPDDYRRFNADRARVLDEYRQVLAEVNRGIRDFNLTAPDALHERPVRTEVTMQQIGERIPAIDERVVLEERRTRSRRPWWQTLRGRKTAS
jgi:hypothetical protein